MKSKSASSWSAAKSEELYGFKRWGSGHLSVDDAGFLNVQPLADGRGIRALDVINEAVGMGLKAPLVIRFQDLLRHRVAQLNGVFNKAIKQEGYKGSYRGVFPIKVNQLREVVDEIVAAGKEFNYGLEAGSKPELMIAIASSATATKITTTSASRCSPESSVKKSFSSSNSFLKSTTSSKSPKKSA